MSLSIKSAPTSARSRFQLDGSRSAPLALEGERVSFGTDPKDGTDHLVYTFGRTSSAVPLYAVGTAIAGGKVIPFTDLVDAIAEAGNLPKLCAVIDKHPSMKA